MAAHSIFLPGESHGQREREADTTEQLTLGLTQSPPNVGTHLLAKMDSSTRVSGRLWTNALSLF